MLAEMKLHPFSAPAAVQACSRFGGALRVQLPSLLLVSLLSWGGHAQAQLPDNITAGEMALLPDYCKDVQATTQYTDRTGGNPSPRAPMWISQMGETFWAMHHHCWALIRMHRARRPGLFEPVRVGTIRGAINDYIYVLRHEKPGFPLKPEIYVRIGEAYAALPAHGEALEWYEKARREKPDYWPGYTFAADTLLAIGRRKEALDLLESGLLTIPGNPEITRKLENIKRADAPKSAERQRPAATAATARNVPPGGAASSAVAVTPK
jgi:tetratricopeptide (TPR) repeat protein